MSYGGQVYMGPPLKGQDASLPGYYGVCPEFTTVLYKADDRVGLACALLSLLPPAILMMHLATFLSRRTAQDLWFAGGQVVCEASNVILKRVLRQARPLSPVLNMPEESYGMPSAHSQFMGFLVGYLFVQMLFSSHLPFWDKIFRMSGTSIMAGAVGFARYYLYYHSGVQVVAGLTFGGVLGALWFLLSRPLRKYGVFEWGLSLWPCRLLLVKDVDYNNRAEYEEYRKCLRKKKE